MAGVVADSCATASSTDGSPSKPAISCVSTWASVRRIESVSMDAAFVPITERLERVAALG